MSLFYIVNFLVKSSAKEKLPPIFLNRSVRKSKSLTTIVYLVNHTDRNTETSVSNAGERNMEKLWQN